MRKVCLIVAIVFAFACNETADTELERKLDTVGNKIESDVEKFADSAKIKLERLGDTLDKRLERDGPPGKE